MNSSLHFFFFFLFLLAHVVVPRPHTPIPWDRLRVTVVRHSVLPKVDLSVIAIFSGWVRCKRTAKREVSAARRYQGNKEKDRRVQDPPSYLLLPLGQTHLVRLLLNHSLFNATVAAARCFPFFCGQLLLFFLRRGRAGRGEQRAVLPKIEREKERR